MSLVNREKRSSQFVSRSSYLPARLLFVWESRLQNVVVVYFRRIGICGSGTLTYSLVVTCSLSALRNVCQSYLGLNPCNFLNAKLVDILFWSIYIQVEVTLSPIWKTTDDD